jgi:hypothetical protein
MISGRDAAALRRELRVALRRARLAANVSPRQVCTALGWPPRRLIEIETGQAIASPAETRELLTYYGVSNQDDIDAVGEMARLLLSGSRPWTDYRDVIGNNALTFFEYEVAASIIRQFETLLVPGVLQTEAYMRAVFTQVFDKPAEHIRRLVDSRLQRQEHLFSDGAPEMFFILDEATIRRQVGGSEANRQQLAHLVELDAREGIAIKILPFDVGANAGMRGPFTILEFADPTADSVLYVENSRGEVVTRDDPEATSEYLGVFWELEDKAVELSRLV